MDMDLILKCSKSKQRSVYGSGNAHKNKENNPLTPVANVHKYKWNYVLKGNNSKLVYKESFPILDVLDQ
ncbi:Hypothetical predicted protein [Octopus vulgaris]|uniref:Uncharacterized protein n=1 Tax=Octopus vulgaris TaxID=6645 RepID=A0AA36EZ00_OCTVU|nr:Hypothetical predicted protein [Octopus vulgaris]